MCHENIVCVKLVQLQVFLTLHVLPAVTLQALYRIRKVGTWKCKTWEGSPVVFQEWLVWHITLGGINGCIELVGESSTVNAPAYVRRLQTSLLCFPLKQMTFQNQVLMKQREVFFPKGSS